MLKLWEAVANIGLSPDDTEEDKKQIRLVNHILFLVFIIHFSYIPVMAVFGYHTYALIMTAFTLAFPFCWLFSRARLFHLTSIVMFVLLILNISGSAIMNGNVGAEFLYLPAGLGAFIVLRTMKGSLIMFSILTICFAATLFLKSQLDPVFHVPELNQTILWYVDLIMIFIVCGLAMFNFKTVLAKYEYTTLIQKLQIESRNKEIMDSINYAQRIQFALLANKELMKQHLPEHFVLFLPKDVVSGDFYWAAKADNKFYLAVCDSTGHGVPGAFMSLLNISFLNEAVNERKLRLPNEILDYVRERLKEALRSSGEEEGGKDGMDCILLCFEENNTLLKFSCAKNPLIIIRKGEVTRYVPDRMPVGRSPLDHVPFTMQTLTLQKGDAVYALTDGFADQFGGADGKKFRQKNLLDKLMQGSLNPMDEQRKVLENELENWKQGLEQVDDVCVIGIRV